MQTEMGMSMEVTGSVGVADRVDGDVVGIGPITTTGMFGDGDHLLPCAAVYCLYHGFAGSSVSVGAFSHAGPSTGNALLDSD